MVRLASVRVSGGGGDAGVYFFSSCSSFRFWLKIEEEEPH